MLTEDEARQKWCPFARVVPSDASGKVWDGAPAGWNRKGLLANPQPARCLASDCMAWRTKFSHYRQTFGEEVHEFGFLSQKYVATGPGKWSEPEEIHVSYCGLAGRPE